MSVAKKQQEMESFIEWCALPTTLRKPKTQKELAKSLKVDPSTLSDWRKTAGFDDRVREIMTFWAREKTPDVILALYKSAISQGPSSSADRRLWLQTFERLTDKTEHQFPDLARIHRTLLDIVERNRKPNSPSQPCA